MQEPNQNPNEMSSMVTFELISSIAFIILVLYQLYRKREAERDPVNEFLVLSHADHVNEAANNLNVEVAHEPSGEDLAFAAEREQVINAFFSSFMQEPTREAVEAANQQMIGAFFNPEMRATLPSLGDLVAISILSRHSIHPISLPRLSADEAANNALNQRRASIGDILHFLNDGDIPPHNDIPRFLLEARQHLRALDPSEEVDEDNNDVQPVRTNTNEFLATFGLFHRRNNSSRHNRLPIIEDDHPEQGNDKAPQAHR